MVASVLPMYLVLQLGLQPFAFGAVDGMYPGVAALVRLGAGVVSDRSRRYKAVAVAGYAVSAVCRLALLTAGSAWGAIAAIVAMDRIGKGVRTAPRDALIALRSPCRELASAFGVHRALDAAGAMLGPLVAFVLLAAVPRRFDVVFVASFAVALVGLSVIVLCVDPIVESARRPPETISTREIARLCRRSDFRALLVVGFLLGVPTISDGFIFLVLQRRLDISFTAFPLFYVATSLFTALFAIPLGKAADRVGRRAVFLGDTPSSRSCTCRCSFR
jgi:MFS family permease